MKLLPEHFKPLINKYGYIFVLGCLAALSYGSEATNLYVLFIWLAGVIIIGIFNKQARTFIVDIIVAVYSFGTLIVFCYILYRGVNVGIGKAILYSFGTMIGWTAIPLIPFVIINYTIVATAILDRVTNNKKTWEYSITGLSPIIAAISLAYICSKTLCYI